MKLKPKGDFIAGRFIKRKHPAGELRSVDPGQLETTLGVFPLHDEAVDEAVAAARAAFAGWSASAELREAGLRKLKAQLQNNADRLTELLSLETGRPRWETREEVLALRQEIGIVLRHGLTELGLNHPPPPGCRVEFRPRGVAAILVPSSQPARSMHADVVAALAVGCTVVVKPAPSTPALGQFYAELLAETDLPRGVFNLLLGDDEAGARLASHADVDVVLFGGREASAQQIATALTSGARATPPLFHARTAGRPAALVLDDANLEQAAVEIAVGACLSTGMRQATTRGVIVHRRIAEALRDRLLGLLSGLRVGHSSRADVFLGPLPSGHALDRYLASLARLRDEGARELLVGGRIEERREEGHYVTPALFSCESKEYGALIEEERAGPLLLFTVVEDLDAGLELLQQCPRQLCHAVFSRDPRITDRLDELALPLVLLNAPTTSIRSDLPLATSGRGGSVTGGILTARALTTPCVTVSRDSAFDSTMLPPGLPRPAVAKH